MTEQSIALIEEWIQQELGKVTIRNPSSKHIDELLVDMPVKEDRLDISFELFGHLIKRLQEMGFPKKPVLIIPLKSANSKIEQRTPRSQEEIEQQFSIEPPSLYLVDWDQARVKNVLEQYRVPLPFELNDAEGIYVTYRESRDKFAIENDWEVSRNIYVEYFSEEFR